MPQSVYGVPTHPFVVHIPVILVPVLALMILAMFRPKWRARLGLLPGLLAIVTFGSVILATETGQDLRRRVKDTQAVLNHVQLGNDVRLPAGLTMLAVVGLAAYELWLLRPVPHAALVAAGSTPAPAPAPKSVAAPSNKLLVGLIALSSVFGLWATVAVIQAGHSGAAATWKQIPLHVPTDNGGRNGG
jgi:hypothetical protein